jgi:cytochrome P450
VITYVLPTASQVSGREEGKSVAIEDYLESISIPVPPDDVHPMTRLLLDQCPVAHSDEDGGFWVINRHADVLRVLQDSEAFASGNKGVRVRHDRVDRPPMPPIDSNRPQHRRVREVMNPFFTPKALAAHEDAFRVIIAGLIEDFAADGQADIATQLAKKFPSQITCQELLKVTDPTELDNLRHWNRRLSYGMFKEDPKDLIGVQKEFEEFAYRLVDERKASPGDDLVSALIQATNPDGSRLLTDAEVVGAIQITVSGGFSTTADATCNIVIRLIEDPELEPVLRAEPDLIPTAIEEVLRLDPPVLTRPRRATADIEIGGKLIRKDDRLLTNYLAANIDPDEWEQPEEFILGRARNRLMTFSAGPHRCIGSTMARVSLRIMTEELLARITAIRYDPAQPVVRLSPNTMARMVDSLPITFTPVAATA